MSVPENTRHAAHLAGATIGIAGARAAPDGDPKAGNLLSPAEIAGLREDKRRAGAEAMALLRQERVAMASEGDPERAE